jgi:F-type H+-transporting ATPase subunit delta
MATSFDISQAAGAVYAESLLQLAEEAGKTEEIGDELWQLRELWSRDPEFAAMMSSAAIDVADRRESVRKAFGAGRVQPLVLNLLLVLNDKRRAMILPRVCEAYRTKLDRRLGREEVHVTTAAPMGEEHRAALRARIKQMTGHDADLFENVDPRLLGGVSVQIGDRLYDRSVRRELRDLQTALLSAGEKRMLGDVSRYVTEGLTP